MRVLVTGSSGLIGSEAVLFFDELGFDVVGVDNNMRAEFFGSTGDTSWNRSRLKKMCSRFRHKDLDIRDREAVHSLFRGSHYELVVHAAAQPSHDLAASRPLDDFDVNAVGTLNLLESCRRHAPEATFVFLSTNKVYGDGPNRLELCELEKRWDFAAPKYRSGIAEDFPIDQCLHSVFGASKVAADVMCQEYGRYYGMRTGVFRGGCLTGPYHSGVELHGFLNYLVKVALAEGEYRIFGYKGKQVRDQIHSRDVVRAIWCFAQNPRPGEVYNLGGGSENAASLLECIELIARLSGKRPRLQYQDANRVGDHICYYSDLRKLRSHFPEWSVERSLEAIVSEIVSRASSARTFLVNAEVSGGKVRR
jgi:CDP-paratose 2-epimerase